MENFITVKREDGDIVTNPAERNIILLRYAAFLNENEQNAGINIIQQHPQQIQHQTIQIIEQPQPQRKSTKANVQNAQGTSVQQTNQKVGG
jgi:hypothetical protein